MSLHNFRLVIVWVQDPAKEEEPSVANILFKHNVDLLSKEIFQKGVPGTLYGVTEVNAEELLQKLTESEWSSTTDTVYYTKKNIRRMMKGGKWKGSYFLSDGGWICTSADIEFLFDIEDGYMGDFRNWPAPEMKVRD